MVRADHNSLHPAFAGTIFSDGSAGSSMGRPQFGLFGPPGYLAGREWGKAASHCVATSTDFSGRTPSVLDSRFAEIARARTAHFALSLLGAGA